MVRSWRGAAQDAVAADLTVAYARAQAAEWQGRCADRVMKVSWSDPSSRFDVTSFSNVIVDGQAGPLTTVSTCLRCFATLAFTRDNFETRASRRFSNLLGDVARAIEAAALERGYAGDDFLDWTCPGCGLATRAYVRAWAGAHHGDAGVDIVAVVDVSDGP